MKYHFIRELFLVLIKGPSIRPLRTIRQVLLDKDTPLPGWSGQDIDHAKNNTRPLSSSVLQSTYLPAGDT